MRSRAYCFPKRPLPSASLCVNSAPGCSEAVEIGMSRSPRARCPARSPRTCPRHPPARAERLPGLRSPKGSAPPPNPLLSLRETKPTTSQVLVSAARHGRVWGTTTTSGPPWERALPVGAASTSPSFKPAPRRRRRRERELPQPTALQQRSRGALRPKILSSGGGRPSASARE